MEMSGSSQPIGIFMEVVWVDCRVRKVGDEIFACYGNVLDGKVKIYLRIEWKVNICDIKEVALIKYKLLVI